MARRHRHEEHENHERWLVSYADFITLLFAFFVVMYSVSSVNEGKFRVLSDSMNATFSEPQRSMSPIQVGKPQPASPSAASDRAPLVVELPRPFPTPTDSGDADQARPDTGSGQPLEAAADGGETDAQSAPPMANIDTVAEQVEEQMAPLIDQDLVKVRREDTWLEVEFNTSILFGSGEARLSSSAISMLMNIADILKVFPNPIQVEGFTDNVPIRTTAYPSNWELSAARAASVVHLFMKAGVRPDRMVAIGYGEHRPVAENDTPQGRSKNRRVVLVIPAEDDARRVLDLQRLSGERSAAPGAGGDS